MKVLWFMSWGSPSRRFGCSSDGHEPTADGECFWSFVLVVLLWCDWKQEMQSCCYLLMSLVGIVLRCHLKTASIVAMLYFSGSLLPNSSAKLWRSGCNPSVAGAPACPMIGGIFFLFFTIPAGLHVKKRVKCHKSMVTTYLCHPVASELS